MLEATVESIKSSHLIGFETGDGGCYSFFFRPVALTFKGFKASPPQQRTCTSMGCKVRVRKFMRAYCN